MKRGHLTIRNLSVSYSGPEGAHPALRDLTLDIQPGSAVGIVGESGSGKSTLLRTIIGLPGASAQVLAGDIVLDGTNLLDLGAKELRRVRRQRVGMVFQDPLGAFNPVETLGRQLKRIYGLNRPHLPRRELVDQIVADLEAVGLDGKSKIVRYPFELSQGELQRAAIAAACMGRSPSILLADEPTASLDVTIGAQVIQLLRRLRTQLDLSLILVSHDLGLVADLCDRVAVVNSGSIVEEASVTSLFRQPAHPYTRALLQRLPSIETRHDRKNEAGPTQPLIPRGCVFAARCPEHLGEICDSVVPGILALPEGDRSVRCHMYETRVSPVALQNRTGEARKAHAVKAHRPPEPPVLEVEDLDVNYTVPTSGGRKAVIPILKRTTLSLGRGESLGLIGESGSGKSTLGLAIVGVVKPAGGIIRVKGTQVWPGDRKKGHERRDHSVQMVFQNSAAAMNRRKLVADIIREPLAVQGRSEEADARVPELLELVGLPIGFRDRYPHELSGGQIQRVGIARALSTDPDVLIADEPTAGLDVSVAASVIRLLRDVQSRLGLSILWISHDLASVRDVCDRVAVMYLGRLVEVGSVEDVLLRAQHPYTQVLVASEPSVVFGARHVSETTALGEIPDPLIQPSGCQYHPRCALAESACSGAVPEPIHVGNSLVACHVVARQQADGPSTIKPRIEKNGGN